MTLPDIKQNLLLLLGVEDESDLPDHVANDCLWAVNTTAQLLNVAGDPFWQLAEGDFDVVAALTPVSLLGHSLKRITKADGTPLMRCEGIREIKQFIEVYYGGGAPGAAPMAYYVDTKSDENGDLDTKIHFAPAPSETVSVAAQYVPRFTAYAVADLDDDDITPSVGHGYVEMVFLPIARYYMTRSNWFSAQEKQKAIEHDFANAVAVLRSANPSLDIPFSDQTKPKQR